MFVVLYQLGKSSEINLTDTLMHSSPDNYPPHAVDFFGRLFNAKEKAMS